MEATAATLAKRLGLVRHPEGGWYRETYRCDEIAIANSLPDRFGGNRSFCTAIYYLLGKNDRSALHRIKSDEIWHFYAGTTLTIHLLAPDGKYRAIKLGSDPATDETYQTVVPAGYWFGAEVSGNGAYSLAGCTVAPGFDFADFEMGIRDELLTQFPEQTGIILRLTRDP